MTGRFQQFRQYVVPRAAFAMRGTRNPPRASSIICGMMIVLLLLVMLAKALTHLFTAI